MSTRTGQTSPVIKRRLWRTIYTHWSNVIAHWSDVKSEAQGQSQTLTTGQPAAGGRGAEEQGEGLCEAFEHARALADQTVGVDHGQTGHECDRGQTHGAQRVAGGPAQEQEP
eukprot:1562387-Rhodomonas_salina.1